MVIIVIEHDFAAERGNPSIYGGEQLVDGYEVRPVARERDCRETRIHVFERGILQSRDRVIMHSESCAPIKPFVHLDLPAAKKGMLADYHQRA